MSVGLEWRFEKACSACNTRMVAITAPPSILDFGVSHQCLVFVVGTVRANEQTREVEAMKGR